MRATGQRAEELKAQTSSDDVIKAMRDQNADALSNIVPESGDISFGQENIVMDPDETMEELFQLMEEFVPLSVAGRSSTASNVSVSSGQSQGALEETHNSDFILSEFVRISQPLLQELNSLEAQGAIDGTNQDFTVKNDQFGLGSSNLLEETELEYHFVSAPKHQNDFIITSMEVSDVCTIFYATNGDDNFIGTNCDNTVIYDGDTNTVDTDTIDLKGGNNTVTSSGSIRLYADSTISFGNGDNILIPERLIVDDGDISFGNGDNIVSIDGTRNLVTNNGSISFGDGDNTFTGQFMSLNNGSISFGDGDDTVVSQSLQIDNTSQIHLGGGDDSIEINNTGTEDIYNLYGGTGADDFIFTGMNISGYIEIEDFSTLDGDVIDISQILTGYDPMTDILSDFVRFTDSGADVVVAVDTDGGGDSFVDLVTLIGNAGLDAATLEANGHLDLVI